MLKPREIPTRKIGTSEFTDSKSRQHIITHSIILTETERKELEEKIKEDLFLILRKGLKH